MTEVVTIPESATRKVRASNDVIWLVIVTAVSAILFGLIFNRESSLSYSIGYNLYGAERILAGEIPYRDFHTLYPPATVYLNAVIFKLFGVGLFAALAGVCVFKVLAVVALYGCGKKLMPPAWAAAGSIYALLWLRPNGPFKAVPMHYGALFLAVGAYFLLRFLESRRNYDLLIAGLSLGILTLFKHNIGAYALLGSAAVIWLGDDGIAGLSREGMRKIGNVVVLGLGCALPITPVVAYMARQHALAAMVRTLFFGPGEFLLRRLAATPSPFVPIIGAAVVAVLIVASVKANKSSVLAGTSILLALCILCAVFCLFSPGSPFSEAVFYGPVAVLLVGLGVWSKAERFGIEKRAGLLALIVAGGAALMESFPRFAREQAIASGPFIGLLAVYLAFVVSPKARQVFASTGQAAIALSLVPLVVLLLGVRIFRETYFSGLHLKSDTELTIDRGRRVFFPAETAEEIDSVVRYIRDRVPEGGYVFAQSYAGSSFLFLADRKNPSAAQFWGGVGVTDEEKRETVDALQQDHVELIVSSSADLNNESYQPMREYVERNFQVTRKFGRIVLLERVKGTVN